MHNHMQGYMNLALELAKSSGEDIPVGCVIVKDGEILARCVNEPEKTNDVSAHAEVLALREASEKLGNWRLDGSEMYVTLEPCPMCAWAILNSRVSKLYFGAYDANYGAFGSKIDLRTFQNSGIKIFGGIMETQCEELLKNYFKLMRAYGK